MNIRQAKPEELSIVYMMGYDVWAEGQSPEQYIESCSASEKYKQGTWFILVDEGKLLSSLIVYTSGFNIPYNYRGIGSVATALHYRSSGYSSFLINAVCDSLERQGVTGVYLHSDIGASFYERLGFTILSKSNSICMGRKFQNTLSFTNVIPSYF